MKQLRAFSFRGGFVLFLLVTEKEDRAGGDGGKTNRSNNPDGGHIITGSAAHDAFAFFI